MGAPPAVVEALTDERSPGHIARLGRDRWCRIIPEPGQAEASVRCVSGAGEALGQPREIFQRQRTQRALERGALSTPMANWLAEHTGDAPLTGLVWGRWAPARREGPRRDAVDPADIHATLLPVIANTSGCQGKPVPGLPATTVTGTVECFERLAREPWVGAIDPVDPEAQLIPQAPVADEFQTMECIELDDADTAFSADGTGISVAVVEGGPAHAVVLAEIPQYAGTNCPTVTGIEHAGMVASVIGADSGGQRAIDGSAAGADLLIAGMKAECFPCTADADCPGEPCNLMTGLCNYDPQQRFLRALDWARGQQANVINVSQTIGTKCAADESSLYDSISRVFDYTATQFPYPVMVTITGNFGADRNSGSVAYNGLVVGGVDYQNDQDRAAHQLWDTVRCTGCDAHTTASACQSGGCLWRAPVGRCDGSGSQGRNRLGLDSLEVPHVVAPAKDVAVLAHDDTLGTPVWISAFGTSFAAPHVAGVAARMLDLTPALEGYPEPVRAAIMASATKSVDGVAFSLNDGVDDTDGAGEVSAVEAERLASASTADHHCWGSVGQPCATRGLNWGPLFDTDFTAPGNYHDSDVYFVPTGDVAQMVLTWENQVTCTPTTLECTGDPTSPMTLALWLWKYTPSTGGWTLDGWALQPNPEDNYLLIRRAVTPGELYRIRFNFPGKTTASTYYGLAWTSW